MAPFDPYHIWLGIPPQDQPPSHYRLLGIPELESNPDVIDGAAEQRTIYLRTFQTGDQVELAEQLLNEVSAARICLLNAESKAKYDQHLQEKKQPALMPTLNAAQDDPLGIGSVQPEMPAWSPPVRELPQRRRTSKPIWQQPRMLATGGGLVAVIVLFVLLSSGGAKPNPIGNPKEPVIAKRDKSSGVADNNKEQEEQLAAEQAAAEQAAAEKAAAEKAAAEREAERHAEEIAAAIKAEAEKADLEREVERRVEERAAEIKAEAEKDAADREAKRRVDEKAAAMKAEAEKAAADREAERLTKELASSKASLGESASSVVDLTGKWRSPETGSVIQLKQQGNIITVSVVSSPTASFIEGVLKLNGKTLKSTSYTFGVKGDPRKTKFPSYVRGYIMADGRLSFSIPTVKLNNNGALLSKGRMKAVYTREK
jgi:chemotaxis protein histidine kinase CheA